VDFLETNVQTVKSSDIATLASRLNLISSILNNFNISKQDEIYVIAGVIGLISTNLVRKSAILEANEQQIAPGVTTFANNLKLIGTSIALISSSILFWALLIEVSLRAQGIQAPQSSATGINTNSGSVLAQ